ncbi:hypothetical protein ALC57_17627 [Trachymyrmex cornetzi]|uniref:Uncharacterized protein n=1 Tax=Trachymyrmex cornetzi TaxID=471704 RepID=A0A151ITF6_9HYME|nr:hypothetical protein ALC57_17627 [Trachymyrmex cornetzi]
MQKSKRLRTAVAFSASYGPGISGYEKSERKTRGTRIARGKAIRSAQDRSNSPPALHTAFSPTVRLHPRVIPRFHPRPALRDFPRPTPLAEALRTDFGSGLSSRDYSRSCEFSSKTLFPIRSSNAWTRDYVTNRSIDTVDYASRQNSVMTTLSNDDKPSRSSCMYRFAKAVKRTRTRGTIRKPDRL